VVLASDRTANRAVVTAALNAGMAIVVDPHSVQPDGTVDLSVEDPYSPGRPTQTVAVPALVLTRPKEYKALPGAFIAAPVLAAHQWKSAVNEILIDYPAGSASHAGAALQAAEAEIVAAYASDTRTGSDRLLRDGLATTSAGAGLVGVLICTALAAAEARPDLETLTAIGAPPGRRRRLGAAQALLPALLGTAVGLALGFWFAVVARATLTVNDRTVVPWHDLLGIVGSVPLAAAVIGVLGALGRPVLTRRAD
jgi:putative ABC transport system permease protein